MSEPASTNPEYSNPCLSPDERLQLQALLVKAAMAGTMDEQRPNPGAALFDIAWNPERFKTTFGVPHPETAAEIEEKVMATALRRRVTNAGYLAHRMIPAQQSIRLAYAATPTSKRKYRKMPPDQVLTLKLTARPGDFFDVAQYYHYDSDNGFVGYEGHKQVPLSDTFTVVAIEGDFKIPKEIQQLNGEKVQAGPFSIGTALDLKHSFRHDAREVPGFGNGTRSKRVLSPFRLTQAYFGDTNRHPLFREDV